MNKLGQKGIRLRRKKVAEEDDEAVSVVVLVSSLTEAHMKIGRAE